MPLGGVQAQILIFEINDTDLKVYNRLPAIGGINWYGMRSKYNFFYKCKIYLFLQILNDITQAILTGTLHFLQLYLFDLTIWTAIFICDAKKLVLTIIPGHNINCIYMFLLVLKVAYIYLANIELHDKRLPNWDFALCPTIFALQHMICSSDMYVK